MIELLIKVIPLLGYFVVGAGVDIKKIIEVDGQIKATDISSALSDF